MEHHSYRLDDLLQRSSCPYGRTARPPSEMREQNPNQNQDRVELKDAFKVVQTMQSVLEQRYMAGRIG